MGWRETKVEDLEIADGFATTLKTKHKLATAGDVAERWAADQLACLLPKPGPSAVQLLLGELKRVSHGEVGGEDPPSTLKFPSANGNGQAAEKAAASPDPAPALPASLPAETTVQHDQALEAVITVPVAEWTRLQKLAERVTVVSTKSDQVQELKAKWAKAKDSSLAAKKNFDEATSELLDMIAGQLRLDFDAEPEKAKPPKEEKATTAADPGTAGVLEKLRSEPDAWRSAPLTVLPTVAADKKLAGRLAKGGLKTMGHLQDVRAAFAEWPKMKEETKEKLIAEADEWLTKNRDAAAFAGAKKESDEREKEFPKQVELTKDILDQAHGNAVLVKAGTIMDTVKCKDDKVGVGVGGVVMELDADEWRPVVKTAKRPKTIQLVKDVPGFASEDDRLANGTELEPIGWSGECALVKTPTGREASVAPSEFEPLGSETVDWPVEEVA